MTKKTKHILKSTLLFVVSLSTSLSLASCSDDDKNVEVAESPINPAGIILMSHPSEVVNGDTAEVLFRLNPSNANLTKEQLSVDCVRANVFTLEDDTPTTKTRASYVQSTPNYTLVDLKKDILNGDSLEGQWVAKILVKTDKNIFDKSLLALVANYKDNNGKVANISSDPFNMDLVPTPEDGITAWAPTLYTDSATKGKLTPYYYFARENMYKNSNGDYLVYDMSKRIRSVKFTLGTLDNDSTTTKQETESAQTNGRTCYVYSYLPNADQEPFSKLLAGEMGSYSEKAILTLTDQYGHEAFNVTESHYNHIQNVTVEVDCPEQLKAGETYSLDLEKALSAVHYSSSEFSIRMIGSHKGQALDLHSYPEAMSISNDVSSDFKTLNIKVAKDCNADNAFKGWKIFMISSQFEWTIPYTTLFKVQITLKRKGA